MATHVRRMNVYVANGALAAKTARSRSARPGGKPPEPEGLAPWLHPQPSHDLHFHGGKALRNLNFTNFYVGGTGSWNASDIQSIDTALAAALSDQDLNNVMMQYFQNQLITSTFTPSQVLPGPAHSIVSQGDIENLVQQLFTQGQLTTFDFTSTVFNFMLPSGTVLNDDQALSQSAAGDGQAHQQAGVRRSPVPSEDKLDSLHGLGGYHGSIHVTDSAGTAHTIYYAVGVFSETRPDGTTNGIPVFDAPWKNVVATFYHELNEARTDADVEDAIRAGNDPNARQFLGWTSRQGEECGDFPVFEPNPLTQVFQEITLTDGSVTVPVQIQYSNAVHGPASTSTAPPPPQNIIAQRG